MGTAGPTFYDDETVFAAYQQPVNARIARMIRLRSLLSLN